MNMWSPHSVRSALTSALASAVCYGEGDICSSVCLCNKLRDNFEYVGLFPFRFMCQISLKLISCFECDALYFMEAKKGLGHSPSFIPWIKRLCSKHSPSTLHPPPPSSFSPWLCMYARIIPILLHDRSSIKPSSAVKLAAVQFQAIFIVLKNITKFQKGFS